MGNVTATKLSAGDAAAAFIGIYILDYLETVAEAGRAGHRP